MGTFKGWVQVLVAVAVIAGFTVTVQKGYYVLTPDLSEATTVLREHRGKCASSHCMNTLRAAERGIRSQRWYIVCVAACAGYLIFFLGCSCYLKRRDLVETRQELSGARAQARFEKQARISAEEDAVAARAKAERYKGELLEGLTQGIEDSERRGPATG